jgi:hypothetical protein
MPIRLHILSIQVANHTTSRLVENMPLKVNLTESESNVDEISIRRSKSRYTHSILA